MASEKTPYIVFRKLIGEPDANVPDAFEIVGRASGHNAEGAIREVVGKLSPTDANGVFAAAPARSWQPVTITAEVQTKLTLKAAG